MSEMRVSEIRSQVKRLAGLDKYPYEDEAVNELVYALDDCAATIEQASAIIDVFLATPQRCPLPADIHRVAWEMRQSAGMPQLGEHSQKCPQCGGTGWIVKQVGPYEGVQRCGGAA